MSLDPPGTRKSNAWWWFTSWNRHVSVKAVLASSIVENRTGITQPWVIRAEESQTGTALDRSRRRYVSTHKVEIDPPIIIVLNVCAASPSSPVLSTRLQLPRRPKSATAAATAA
jgi:hypothetical protein